MNLKVLGMISMCLVSMHASADEGSSGEGNFDASAWDEAHLKVPPWTERSGQGVGLGYQHGAWGGQWAQELKLRIPVARAFSVNLSGVYLHNEPIQTHNLGGRLVFTGGTPVYLNLIRIYGGGGVDLLKPINRASEPAEWGGGGFFGFEFFLAPRYSFFSEIGGRGSKRNSGATIMAGFNFYPF